MSAPTLPENAAAADAQDELDEMLLKSRATVGALSESDLTVIPMTAAG